MYRSKRVYEICFRALEGLPLPARPLANLIIRSALARAQRDDKVIFCGGVWMSNHPHLLVVSKDVNDLMNFYGEVKKKLTDMLKRLLGCSRLSVWPDEPAVIEILDLEAALKRNIYFFLNPARANLVDSIDEYTGVSTWKEFCETDASTEAYVEWNTPWIRLPSIPKLSRHNPSRAEEERVIQQLIRANKDQETLRIYPFAWLKAFGVTEEGEIEKVRQSVISEVRLHEAELRKQRAAEKRGVASPAVLLQEGFLLSGHVPKKKERRIYFISTVMELRLSFIRTFRRFCDECRECFERATRGITGISWPEGAFIPPIRPMANPL
jgi:hypothetical protein